MWPQGTGWGKGASEVGGQGEEMATVAITLKEKKPGQRACNEKNAKGQLCLGHLKRWYEPGPEVLKELGNEVEIYRCERCHALYRPAPTDQSTAGQKYTQRMVNIWGDFSDRKA